MFDKLFKKKANQLAKDDFFKDEEEAITGNKNEDPAEYLKEDLKAFTEDLKIKKNTKEIIEADNEEIEEGEEIEEEDKASEKWPIKRQNTNPEDDWLDKDYEEGELAVDVYQDKDNVYVKSTIAGVSPENIDITLHNDMLTIRGKREEGKQLKDVDYFYQECFWGSFSRSIILPVEVKADKIDAFLKDGILTIVLPKVKKGKGAKIKVKEK